MVSSCSKTESIRDRLYWPDLDLSEEEFRADWAIHAVRKSCCPWALILFQNHPQRYEKLVSYYSDTAIEQRKIRWLERDLNSHLRVSIDRRFNLIENHWYSSLYTKDDTNLPQSLLSWTQRTERHKRKLGNKTFIPHNLTRIKQISCEKIQTFKRTN